MTCGVDFSVSEWLNQSFIFTANIPLSVCATEVVLSLHITYLPILHGIFLSVPIMEVNGKTKQWKSQENKPHHVCASLPLRFGPTHLNEA